MVACTFCFSISRYLGLSGNQGSIISWMKVGTTTTERNRGQCSSCSGDDTMQSVGYAAAFTAHAANEIQENACWMTFPRSSWRPRTCARKTPVPMKMLGTRPRKPRRFFGAISPRYIGTTLREMPAVDGPERKLVVELFITVHIYNYI